MLKFFDFLVLLRTKQEDNHFVLSFTLEYNSRVNDNAGAFLMMVYCRQESWRKAKWASRNQA